MRGLYAIIDAGALAERGLDVALFANAVLSASPAALQLRDKRGHAGATLEALRAIQPRAERAAVPIFVNDRPDLALLAGCAGVHVGQHDLPPSAARELARRAARPLMVGMSVHDDDELERAIHEAVDYLALGAVFPTSSKQQSVTVLGLRGLDALVERARRARSWPIVAIGGVTLATAGEVGARCDAAAVIGALLPPNNATNPYAWVSARAAALHRALVEARPC